MGFLLDCLKVLIRELFSNIKNHFTAQVYNSNFDMFNWDFKKWINFIMQHVLLSVVAINNLVNSETMDYTKIHIFQVLLFVGWGNPWALFSVYQTHRDFGVPVSSTITQEPTLSRYLSAHIVEHLLIHARYLVPKWCLCS